MKEYKHRVQYYETDTMQVTHHSNYIRFMEEARVEFFDQIGWCYKKFEDEGIVSPVIEVSCQYKKPTRFYDVIYIDIEVEEVTAAKLKLKYSMRVNEDIVCTASSSHCFIDSNGRPVSMKKIYPEMYELLSNMMRN